jgi:CheY-like chemotaxis protein
MVGEIRDSETASIAFQAGQTGHFVLSTLHTNDAPSAVTRLLDLGIPAFLISASLISVVEQRLVRKICNRCKSPDPLTPQILKEISQYVEIDKEMTFWRGSGCDACQFTGYSGRMGIFEILMVTPSLKEIIQQNVSALTLKKAAEREGYQSMAIDGIKNASKGLTTIEEVYRVAPPESKEPSRSMIFEQAGVEEIAVTKSSVRTISSVKPKKILVAEDNKVTLRLLTNFLESENYLVVTASNGLDAFRLTMKEKPDLIITDLIMPEMDGMTLTKKLKSQLITRYLPIIMLTLKDDVDSVLEETATGADDYIKKPVNSKTLLAKVNRLLNRNNLKRNLNHKGAMKD